MPEPAAALPGKATSVWLDTTATTAFPALDHDLEVDVLVVGGGIAGLSAATLLKEAGRRVALVEGRRIASAVTGHTTAKVSALHGLTYHDLCQRHGEHAARVYAEVNQRAVTAIAERVSRWGIDCDFRFTEAYVYSTAGGTPLQKIHREVEVAARLGLPASFVTATELPFEVAGAIRLEHQACFHPRKYLLALANALPGNGCALFEQTPVLEVEEGEPCLAHTARHTIRARDVILASHYPFSDHSLYALRLSPHRGQVLGLRVDGPLPQGIYLSGDGQHSLRTQPVADGELLLVGGEGHRLGSVHDTREPFHHLEHWARQHFAVRRVEYHWSAHDHVPADGLPYIGRLKPFNHHVYTATGFAGWGMTQATAAAELLRDLVLGQEHPAAAVFDPGRIGLTGGRQLLRNTYKIAEHLVLHRLHPGSEDAVLAPGEGRLVETAVGKLGLYRDEAGELHAVKPVCSHMGCALHWNPAEYSWDCPCHGSRFDVDGAVLRGPALESLETMDDVPGADGTPVTIRSARPSVQQG